MSTGEVTGCEPFAARTTLAGVLCALLAMLFAVPAHAQDGSGADPRVGLTVTGLTGVLGPGSVPPPSEDVPPTPDDPGWPDELQLRVLVENDGETAMDSLQLVVEIHPAARSRAALHTALEGELGADADHVHTMPVRPDGGLEPGDVVGLEAAFGPDEVSWAEDGGVHPVRVAVLRGTRVLTEVVTGVVWLAEPPADPMLTSVMWPLNATPWRTEGGTYHAGVDRAVRPGGRLDVLTTALESSTTTAVIPAPAAHLLEDLADRSDGFTALERLDGGTLEQREVSADDPAARLASSTLRRLRTLADDLPFAPVSGPYADADLPALLDGDPTTRELAARAALEGRRRLQLQLGRDIDASTTVLRGAVNPEVLDLVPGDVVVLPYAATDRPPIDDEPALQEPVASVRAASGRFLTAVIADPYLQETLSAAEHPGGDLLAAQRTVATSAMAYLDDPDTPDRGLLLLPDSTWGPRPGVLRALLDGLHDAPWLHLTTPGSLAATATRAPGSIGLHTPDAGFDEQLTDRLGEASRDLDAATTAMPEGTSRIDGRTPEVLADDLLRASSRRLHDDRQGETHALLRGVEHAVETSFGEVEVASGGVTLTSDTGDIPVTLQRTSGGPITVAIELLSQGRLQWPDGRRSQDIVLDGEGASQTVTFATEAVSTGTFPVTVRVTDPGGTEVLTRSTMSVRSTAFSGPALTVTGVIVLVLLLLGALRRRDRPTPRLELIPPDPAEGGQHDPAGRPS